MVARQSNQGIKNLSAEVAEKLTGEDPDYATRDLYNAIENKDFPSWTLSIQVMTFKQAETVKFNPFDLTKALTNIFKILSSYFKKFLNFSNRCRFGLTRIFRSFLLEGSSSTRILRTILQKSNKLHSVLLILFQELNQVLTRCFKLVPNVVVL